jgi:hypothetical protein
LRGGLDTAEVLRVVEGGIEAANKMVLLQIKNSDDNTFIVEAHLTDSTDDVIATCIESKA